MVSSRSLVRFADHSSVLPSSSMTPTDRAAQASPLHLVSAWAADARLCLGQLAVGDKSNEIGSTGAAGRHNRKQKSINVRTAVAIDIRRPTR
jgi:hypothetical protein